MYGKLFASMYDGSLATEGPWEALVTFQQMLILADQEGFVDMTASAISRRTIIPIEIIQKGIAELEKPDPQSRDPANGGRRIERISDTRDWGWQILNYAKYRQIRSSEERREYMRAYMADKREREREAAGKPPTARKQSAIARNRGTRLPDEWRPNEASVALARELGVDPIQTIIEFRDWWIAQPGSKGVKLDWEATWRTWVRKNSRQGAKAASGPPWWSSDKGIEAKGRELGMTARAGESWQEFKGRINERLSAQ